MMVASLPAWTGRVNRRTEDRGPAALRNPDVFPCCFRSLVFEEVYVSLHRRRMTFSSGCRGPALASWSYASATAQAQGRMPRIPPEKMTPEQQKAAAEFMETRETKTINGPFIALLRSPNLINLASEIGLWTRRDVVASTALRVRRAHHGARQHGQSSPGHQRRARWGAHARVGECVREGHAMFLKAGEAGHVLGVLSIRAGSSERRAADRS